MRMRRKKNLIPRMEQCDSVWIRRPADYRGVWLNNRPECQLHVEIGCGKGTFTVQTAAADTDVLLIGIERIQNVLLTAMERTCDLALSNLLFLDIDAGTLPDCFDTGEVSRIYLNFSDPWPSTRHEKRRLTSPTFLALYKQVLAPGGEIHMKTDNHDLFTYSLPQFELAGFTLNEVTEHLHEKKPVGVMTDYERKFHTQGVPICRCVAKLG